MRYTQLLDRPIAFHRCFVDITGSVPAALFLSQAVYWSSRTKDLNGWFYKTQEEWEDETGITRRVQETVRKNLRDLGVLEEVRRGTDPTIYYRVNTDRVHQLLGGIFSGEVPMVPTVGTEGTSGKARMVPQVNNTKITNIDYTEITKPWGWGDVFLKKWNHWREYKKVQFNFTYKSAMSEKIAIANLHNLSSGDELIAAQIIDRSIGNGWQGLFKLDNDGSKINQGSNSGGAASSGTSAQRNRAIEDY